MTSPDADETPCAPSFARNAGTSYVIFGSGLTASNGEIDLATLTPDKGVVIEGIDSSDQSGASVSYAGDVDDDGLDDIIIGARFAYPGGIGSAGESYVIYGEMLLQVKADDGLVHLDDWFL